MTEVQEIESTIEGETIQDSRGGTIEMTDSETLDPTDQALEDTTTSTIETDDPLIEEDLPQDNPTDPGLDPETTTLDLPGKMTLPTEPRTTHQEEIMIALIRMDPESHSTPSPPTRSRMSPDPTALASDPPWVVERAEATDESISPAVPDPCTTEETDSETSPEKVDTRDLPSTPRIRSESSEKACASTATREATRLLTAPRTKMRT